ncbi:basic amino acid/polyamine antiporter [Acidimangrovimonas sediminis]|uniref:basic amino acid/polyamine antiporter n=1 Tax=Acidimangrovimonas sediminis TaxID=2056283 RepID=UPI000C8003B7|nr:basic amino acid/polyamine antiporter [Acidimangrovimonas sediminis]
MTDNTFSPTSGAASGTTSSQPVTRRLGLFALVGMVVGSMVGGGAFNLPSNMAQGAALGAEVIAWIITGVGMFFLANTFRTLADKRPDLDAGIYSYAREGFGRLTGFQMAWGYWLSSAFGNVAFAVLIMQTLSYFFPVLGNGQNWASLIGGSVLIWAMHFMVLSGVKRAALLNALATVTKLAALAAAIVVLLALFKAGPFTADIWGAKAHLGSVLSQVKSTMLVTLWVFIGIEGAVVVSGRASSAKAVGAATFIGLAICLVAYVLLSILPFGVMTQQQLAGLKGPSLAYVIEALVGSWGATVVMLAVLVSILSCWLAWTILVAELPFEAAKDGVFPRFLSHENANHAPAPALWLSTIVMQATMFVVLYAHDAWLFLVGVTGVMILPAYLASTAYLWKYGAGHPNAGSGSEGRAAMIWTGILGSVYAVWMLYAAGPEFILLSVIMFAIGLPVYWYAEHSNPQGRKTAFTGAEAVASVVLVLVAVLAIVLFAMGIVSAS